MKSPGMRPITLSAVLGILHACTAAGPASSISRFSEPVEAQMTAQMRASDRMYYWREESRELHAMATHREREAELVLRTQHGSTTNEFVKQMRLLARQLRQAAEYADAQAKEAERQIPPDTIQRLHSALR